MTTRNRLPPLIFDALRDIVHRESGINLTVKKNAMLASRLMRRQRELGCASAEEYLTYLESRFADEIDHFIDLVTTNVTSFFRGPEHFRVIGETAARWMREGRQRIRVWSAACASGEEPYSVAMLLDATARRFRWSGTFSVHATDLCGEALRRLAAATYPESALTDVPGDLRRYLHHREDGGRNVYEVDARLRAFVSHGRLNLARPPYAVTGKFDIVLCRNVLMYFAPELAGRIVDGCLQQLQRDGLLLLGFTDRVDCNAHALDQRGPSIYGHRMPAGTER